MAWGTGVQKIVTGELTVAPWAGAVICGAWVGQFVDTGTMNVRVADVSGSQPLPRRATTNHVDMPLSEARVSVVAAVVAARESLIQSSYSVAPFTADQVKVTGEVTVAPLAGSCSDGGTAEHVGGAVTTVVVAEAALFAGFGSAVEERTSAVL